jgi:ATP-dependent Clp endopeptidase proteolytic subunit ClpP
MKELLMSGVVGYEINVEDTKSFFDEAGGEDIRLLITSGGGSVFTGLAISNIIKNYEGKVEAKIIGLAASMATYISLAADKVIAEDDAVFMIHNPSGFVFGDQNDMAKMSKTLESIANLIAKKYQEKTGRKIEDLRKEMDDETFFFGDEIKEAGFADEMTSGSGKDKKASLDNAELEIISALESMEKEKFEPEKIAAYLPDVNAGGVDVHNSKEREDSAKNQESENEVSMDLKQFLAENLEAKKEYDSAIKAAKNEGAESVQARIEAVKPFMESADYKEVHEECIQAIIGTEEVSTVKAMVKAIDKVKSLHESDQAADETKEQGKVPAESGKEDETENNYQARLKKFKKS